MLHCSTIKTQKGWNPQMSHFSKRGMRQIHFNLCDFISSLVSQWIGTCTCLLSVLKPFGHMLLLPGPWHKRFLISLLNDGAHSQSLKTQASEACLSLSPLNLLALDRPESAISIAALQRNWSLVHNCVAFWSILAGWFSTLSQCPLCLDKKCA